MTRALGTVFAISIAFAAEPEWPSFRGPSSNPAVANSNLPDTWSKSENVEWTTDIPGLGWSSPIVSGKSVFLTTVITDGKAKQPQTGVDYSNDYVAELQKQGGSEKKMMELLNVRDFEPGNMSLRRCLNRASSTFY